MHSLYPGHIGHHTTATQHSRQTGRVHRALPRALPVQTGHHTTQSQRTGRVHRSLPRPQPVSHTHGLPATPHSPGRQNVSTAITTTTTATRNKNKHLTIVHRTLPRPLPVSQTDSLPATQQPHNTVPADRTCPQNSTLSTPCTDRSPHNSHTTQSQQTGRVQLHHCPWRRPVGQTADHGSSVDGERRRSDHLKRGVGWSGLTCNTLQQDRR